MQRNKQTFIHSLLLSVILLLQACSQANKCAPPQGAWENGDGQTVVFQENGQLLWLDRFGSSVDTTVASFQFNCQSNPVTLDIQDFKAGPFRGKTLYGIMEWSSDTTLRLRYEAGSSAASRPKAFDSDLTQQFVKVTQ
ncbi:MAG: hypothetical protein IPL65_07495 [Lewinellaceae bacterium]|nr:hypothetical protein [Lewinellaceae bacterium]